MNEKIGVIVDGSGDYASLNRRFKETCKIVKTDGPRGHTAKPDDIASRSRKQISILKAFKCKKVVVVLDLEKRNVKYFSFLKDLENAFRKSEFGVEVEIAVPNIMIENWYLADIKNLSKKKKFLKNDLKQKNYEGTHGKNELKKLMEKKYSYSETVHGPQLFSVLCLATARENSPSFKNFLHLVEIDEFKT
ncbi:DUF4276 family protein [bacterium]|nr:DUF4276 family protein [bacterium]